MLDLSNNTYTAKQVMDKLHMVDSTRKIKIRYDLLNYYDVKIGELTSQGGSVNFNSQAEIKRTAMFNFKETDSIDWLNDRVQPIFMLKMTNEFIEWPLGIFLMSSPSEREKNNKIYRSVEAYDKSLILKEDCFTTRYRIAANTNYIDAITSILNNVGIFKINIPYLSGVIAEDKEFEIGTTKLQAINDLLKEINYTTITVDAYGYFIAQPYLLPTSRETDYSYKTDSKSIIQTGATREKDLFNLPNTWVAYVSTPEKATLISTYINDKPTSITSTTNRKRTITKIIKLNDILDQTTLDSYVQRIAYEDMQVYENFIFNTAIMPHHSDSDCLFIEHSDLNTSAKYIEANWSIELKASGKMQHSCRRLINV